MIVIDSADEAWKKLVLNVQTHGNPVYIKGVGTRELLHAHARIDMTRPIITVPDRKLGYRFLMREAWWILSGRNDVYSIKNYADIAKYSDDGTFFFGAYGPKVISQLPYVLHCLTKDLHSRQAVIVIWRESPPESKDIPCSITCQFLVRGRQLHVFLNMRSSDIYLGVPYDWFNFSMLGAYVTLFLRYYADNTLELGYLFYSAASCHYYDRDEVSLLSMKDESRPYAPLNLDEFGRAENLRRHLEDLSIGGDADWNSRMHYKFGVETLEWRENRHDDKA